MRKNVTYWVTMYRSEPASVRIWMELSLILAEAAGEAGIKALAALRPRRRGAYRTRRPGAETPCWNGVARLLRSELKARGTKARVARYLGIPRQRLSEYLTSRKRIPDTEIALQLLHWLVERRAGRDLSL
jgi:hypothetical protein